MSFPSAKIYGRALLRSIASKLYGAPMDLSELRDLLKQQCAQEGSQTAWAAKNEVAQTYVSGVIRGINTPGQKILDALGLRARTIYERIEE